MKTAVALTVIVSGLLFAGWYKMSFGPKGGKYATEWSLRAIACMRQQAEALDNGKVEIKWMVSGVKSLCGYVIESANKFIWYTNQEPITDHDIVADILRNRRAKDL